ncbi:MAG: glycosyltransferase family 2 protein [Candidatus Limnocylindrales bacterium]
MAAPPHVPRFSIVIPVYDGARWLPGAIESVLEQTYPDWEVVVGDNASNEELGPIVARYGDPRLRLEAFEEHVDIFQNFDRSEAAARGAWVYLLPVDDRLRPRCLERIAAAIDAHGGPRRLAAVITAAARLDPEGRPADVRYYGFEGPAHIAGGTYDAAGWVRQLSAPGSPPWDGGAFDRAIIREMGVFYRTDIPSMSADLELTMRVAAFGDVAYLDEALIAVTAWPESHTHGRFGRNLSSNEPYTTQGIAYATALRAHEGRRVVSEPERALVRAVIARSHLRRAAAHRYREGGRGRAGAWSDIARALRLSPGTVVRRLPQATALLLAPRGALVAARERTLRRRSGSDPDRTPG